MEDEEVEDQGEEEGDDQGEVQLQYFLHFTLLLQQLNKLLSITYQAPTVRRRDIYLTKLVHLHIGEKKGAPRRLMWLDEKEDRVTKNVKFFTRSKSHFTWMRKTSSMFKTRTAFQNVRCFSRIKL